jgi:hypothetical protein
MYYAGVGSRSTPPDILQLMTRVARRLDTLGWTLRSGGARGADRAFELGATKKQIFYAEDCTPLAMSISKIYHPAWDCIPEWAKKLHGRNAMQILGPHLDIPSAFVVCWTPDGAQVTEETTRKSGGTGQAIRIADAHNIPIFNLKHKDALQRLAKILEIK